MSIQIRNEAAQGLKASLAAKDLSALAHWTKEEILLQAFRLALFLMPVKPAAVQIALEAINLSKLKGYEKEAHRRRWEGKGKEEKHRKYKNGPTGILLHDHQLIQSLVYYAAEKYERCHEGNRSESIKEGIKTGLNRYGIPFYTLISLLESAELTREDLVVRYLKAAASYSKNCSKTLATAVACFVCNLMPKDASDIHSVFNIRSSIIDLFFKDISPNDCSKQKIILMRKLEERFGSFIEICKPVGKQTYFKGQERIDARYAGLVEEFFRLAAPWGTKCPEGPERKFSERFHNWLERETSDFKFRFITKADRKRIFFIHVLTCPDCFPQLFCQIKSRCPRERLALPDFNMHDNGEDNLLKKQDRRMLLTPEELEELQQLSRQYLSHEEARRRAADPKKLMIAAGDAPIKVCINGEESDYIDLDRSCRASFKVGEGGSFLKILAEDKEGFFPVAIIELNDDKIAGSFKRKLFGSERTSVELPGGKTAFFSIKRLAGGDEEEGFLLVDMFIHENSADAFESPLKSDRTWSRSPIASFFAKPVRAALIAVAATAILIGSAALVFYMFARENSYQTTELRPESRTDNYDSGVKRGAQSASTPQNGTQPIQSNSNSTESALADAAVFELKPIDAAKAIGQTEPVNLRLQAKSRILRLNLKLSDSLQRKKYIAEVESAEIGPLWRSNVLRAKNESNGAIATAEIPVRIFISGQSYSLILKETNAETEKSRVLRYAFRIEKY